MKTVSAELWRVANHENHELQKFWHYVLCLQELEILEQTCAVLNTLPHIGSIMNMQVFHYSTLSTYYVPSSVERWAVNGSYSFVYSISSSPGYIRNSPQEGAIVSAG